MRSSQPLSHLQWYLHHSKNTVYLAASSTQNIDERGFLEITEAFMNYAPQLGSKADTDGEQHEAVEFSGGEILNSSEAGSLNKGLSEFLYRHGAVYDDPRLPNFRASGLTGKQVGDENPRSLYACMSSHALMEGSESARVLLAKPATQPTGRASSKIGIFKRGMIGIAGGLLAPMHLLASRFNKKDTRNGKWLIIDLDRKAIKKIASENGVNQRSVLFSLPLHWLQSGPGASRPKKKRTHIVSYSTLPREKTTLEDSALNVRMQVARFQIDADYIRHLRRIDEVISRENKTEIYSQAFYNAILGVHRTIHRIFPALYGEKFFTYVPYDFVLSLLPPHIARGPFRKYFDRSIYCGSYTPGVNSCVFVPHRNGVSLNLFLDSQTHANADSLLALLDQLNISHARLI
jgi:hypothetical protein